MISKKKNYLLEEKKRPEVEMSFESKLKVGSVCFSLANKLNRIF